MPRMMPQRPTAVGCNRWLGSAWLQGFGEPAYALFAEMAVVDANHSVALMPCATARDALGPKASPERSGSGLRGLCGHPVRSDAWVRTLNATLRVPDCRVAPGHAYDLPA